MTNKEFERIKKTETLKFIFSRDWDCVFIGVLSLISLIGMLLSLTNNFSTNNLMLTFFLLMINIYVYWGIRKRFSFIRIKITHPINYDIFLIEIENKNWNISIKQGAFANVHTLVRPFSWGESLTLVFCKGYILYNNCPNRGRPFYTLSDYFLE